MKKRMIGMLLTAALGVTCLAGCGSSTDNSAAKETTDTAKETSEAADTQADTTAAVNGGDYKDSLAGKKLTVGCDTSFVPFCFPDDSNTYVGFDIDMLAALSDYLGFEYDLQPMDFTALLMSVQTNKLDMALAGITITDERAQVMDISDPYYDAGLQIFVKDDNEDITQISNLEGKKIALKEGTASIDYVNENVKDCTVTTFPNIESAYLEVQRGAADAVVYDAPNMKYYLSQNPDSGCKVVGDLMDGCQYGIMLQKGSDYTEYIDAALEAFKEDGTYDAIYEKWFGEE